MQEAQPVQEVDVNNVVVLPTSVRQDTVRTRVTTMIVCADPGRAASLDSAMGAMGLDTTVLAAGRDLRSDSLPPCDRRPSPKMSRSRRCHGGAAIRWGP